MRSLRTLLAIGTALAMFPLAPAHARWPEQQRRELVASCMKTCQAKDASSIGSCDIFCMCMSGETERAYPDPQVYIQLRQANDPAYVRRMQTIDQICSSR